MSSQFVTRDKEIIQSGGGAAIPPIILYCIIFSIGCYLRLWHITSQMFLDDEWHAINFVLDKSAYDVFFKHGMGANSIPINVWSWLSLHTFGWSELTLKFPSIATGITSLIVLPYLVKKLWGISVALIFTALLSTSPLIIFYSRIARPFSPAMLFGATSILLTLLWIREGKKFFLYLSGLLGFLAFYFHLYSIIPVATTFLIISLASFKPVAQRTGISVKSQSPWSHITPVAIAVIVLSAIFIGYPNITNPWWTKVQGISHSNLNTFITFIELIAGTSQYRLAYTVLFLIPFGCYIVYKKNRVQGLVLIISTLFFAIIIANYTQDGAHAAIQAARYGIVFFPIFYILIAFAIDWLASRIQKIAGLSRHRWLVIFILFCLWTPFLLTSPLNAIYTSPANFTNHSGFQYNYRPISWDRSPERELAQGISISYNEIPIIYRMPQVLSRYKGIIEYPMAIGDHFNLLYYYQHFHKRPVIAGYSRKDTSVKAPPQAEWVYGNRTIDYIMTSIPQEISQNAITWKSMVNIEQPDILKSKYSGWLFILHKNPCREVSEHLQETDLAFNTLTDLPTTYITIEYLTKYFGSPFLQTNHIAAWSIH